MQHTTTPFDAERHHIYTQIVVTHPREKTKHSFLGIIDTGAPFTEFVDSVLIQSGFIETSDENVKIKEGLQSQKYGRITFPEIEICGKTIKNFNAYISKLEASWGVDVLIGLDFFRNFDVTISYKRGLIVVEYL